MTSSFKHLAVALTFAFLLACGGSESGADPAGADAAPEPPAAEEPAPAPAEDPAAADAPEADSAPGAAEEAAAEGEGDAAAEGDAPAGEGEAAADALSAPAEEGLDEGADFGGSLVDPRFPNTQDSGPEDWPAWRPTHSIELIEVPMISGETLTFTRAGAERVVRGELYLEGDKLEVRHKLFENGTRVAFERIQCRWQDQGNQVELGCKSPDNKTVATLFAIVRTEGSFTMTLADDSVKFAPRKISAKLL